MWETQVTDVGLARLAGQSALTSLVLDKCAITDASAPVIAGDRRPPPRVSVAAGVAVLTASHVAPCLCIDIFRFCTICHAKYRTLPASSQNSNSIWD